MHPKAADEIVKLCRRRSEGGDCPAETPASIETLEETILELDRRLQLKPDPECEAGVLHWEAPNNEIESLRAKLAEAEKDAERYRGSGRADKFNGSRAR